MTHPLLEKERKLGAAKVPKGDSVGAVAAKGESAAPAFWAQVFPAVGAQVFPAVDAAGLASEACTADAGAGRV